LFKIIFLEKETIKLFVNKKLYTWGKKKEDFLDDTKKEESFVRKKKTKNRKKISASIS
jgi:hypothetical protein